MEIDIIIVRQITSVVKGDLFYYLLCDRKIHFTN